MPAWLGSSPSPPPCGGRCALRSERDRQFQVPPRVNISTNDKLITERPYARGPLRQLASAGPALEGKSTTVGPRSR